MHKGGHDHSFIKEFTMMCAQWVNSGTMQGEFQLDNFEFTFGTQYIGIEIWMQTSFNSVTAKSIPGSVGSETCTFW